MESLPALRSFARVAELGSFTRAAAELGLSRAMVTTHVQRLERRFGLKLLHRTTRRVAVTPAGADLLAHCRRVFEELAAAEETLRQSQAQPAGRLRVEVPGAFGRNILLPALPEFLARYPGLQLELRLNERAVDLVQEGVDLAVRAGPITDPNLVARPICGSRWVTCASPVYLATHGRPERIADLANHRLIGSVPAHGTKPRPWIFAGERPLEPRFQLSLNEVESVMLAAANGAGIAQTLDLLAARPVVEGRLVLLLREMAAPGPMLSIVHPPAAERLARVRVFAGFLRTLLDGLMRRTASLLP